MVSLSDSYRVRLALIAGGIAVALLVLVLVTNRLARPASPPEALEDEAAIEAPEVAVEEAGDAAASAEGGDGRLAVQLFLIDSQSRTLVPSFRRVQAPESLAGKARAAIELLIRTNGSPLPPETVVHEIFVSQGGIAYVDFAASLPQLMAQGSLAELHAVFGVVGTLTSIPGIRAVQFLVEHRPIDTLTGHVDVEGPVEPLRGWVF